MSPVFFSRDFGALVWGREVLKKIPQAHLSLQVATPIPESVSYTEADFWNLAIGNIFKKYTRFGRIGLFWDRKNNEARQFFSQFDFSQYPYQPHEKRRAEKKAKVSIFQTQIIHEMANEGQADTVEFRRITRKYIRKAKNHHLDTIFFAEAIFGEEKTKNILQHLAGSQIKIVCVTDFLWEHPELLHKFENKMSRDLCVFTGDEIAFTHKRAEKILRSKVSLRDIKHVQ